MAQSIHETAPGTSEIHSPGYARHTISSSQRQRKPQMSDRKRSASKNSANTGFPNLHVEHVAREGFMPNSSVRSNTRAETSSLQAGYTPARVSRPSPQPTSTSSQLPNSPPPKYMERSELPIQSHTTNFPPSPVLSLSPPPLYHERTPEQERGILTCSHADEDSRESETVPPSLGVLAKSFFNSSIAGSLTDYNASYQANRPATPTFLPMCCANRRKAYADSTIASRQRQRGRQISSPKRSAPDNSTNAAKSEFQGKALKFLERWSNKTVHNFNEGLDTNPNLDDHSRASLADIFAAVDSIPSSRAVALDAYLHSII